MNGDSLRRLCACHDGKVFANSPKGRTGISCRLREGRARVRNFLWDYNWSVKVRWRVFPFVFAMREEGRGGGRCDV